MEWEQLDYFRVAAKTEHFRKGAVQLTISQPTLSRSTKKLEEELGVSLFDGNSHSVQLNKFGKRCLRRVERGLNEISLGIKEIDHLKKSIHRNSFYCFFANIGIIYFA